TKFIGKQPGTDTKVIGKQPGTDTKVIGKQPGTDTKVIGKQPGTDTKVIGKQPGTDTKKDPPRKEKDPPHKGGGKGPSANTTDFGAKSQARVLNQTPTTRNQLSAGQPRVVDNQSTARRTITTPSAGQPRVIDSSALRKATLPGTTSSPRASATT